MPTWKPDLTSEIARRPGKSPLELNNTSSGPTCPDIWELDNGDFVVVGHEVTDVYEGRLPQGLSVAEYESLIVIPRSTLISAAEALT